MKKIILTIAVLASLTQVANASLIIEGYTVNQWVNAIYIAEGGLHATYPYGIRIKNKEGKDKIYTKEQARKICTTTVRRNYQRYVKSKNMGKSSFLEYLSQRYCPTTGTLSKSEIKLNHYWKSNVSKILRRGTERKA